VRIAEEVAGVDHLGGEVEGVVMKEDGAEDGPLRLEIVGERPFGDGGIRHTRRLELRTERLELEAKRRYVRTIYFYLFTFKFSLLKSFLPPPP
jgi:hypothetical protein